ncbi:MAG: M16 family metallopeptidase [Armatimonadota bacterium]
MIVRVLLLSLILALASAASAEVWTTTLPGGMKVLIRDGHTANLVAVDVWVRAGSANETEAESGVSHFVEHMVFKATEKYGPGEVDRAIEGTGADLSGGTAKDYVHFYTTTASEHLGKALDVLSDAVGSALFRPEDVEKERMVLADEIARASDPEHRMFDLVCGGLFAGHSYSLPSTGTRGSIQRLTRDQLLEYYRKFYTPANTCVVIAGDISPREAVDLVRKAFAGYNRANSQALSVPPSEPEKKVLKGKYGGAWAHVGVGFAAPPASELRDLCALDVARAVLGDERRGRLVSALRAGKVRFSRVLVDYVPQRYAGVFYAYAAVHPDDAEKAQAILLSELCRLSDEPLTDEELEQARDLVVGSDLYEQETFAGQARALGLFEMLGKCDAAVTYAPTAGGISAEDVLSAARKCFRQDNYTSVVLTPQ